jgi:hypothetical protein
LRIIGKQRLDAGVVDRMAELRICEEDRQRHAREPLEMQRKVGDDPARAVAGQQRNATNWHCGEGPPRLIHRLAELTVAQLSTSVVNCDFVFSVAAECRLKQPHVRLR